MFSKAAIKQAFAARLGIISLAPSHDHSVVLTFDDGPDPEVTPKVLDLLDLYGFKAVFFVVGNRIPKAPNLLREIVERGHQLGNHSYSHWMASPPGYRAYAADLQRCQAVIEDRCGIAPDVFRPPLGEVAPASLLAARRLRLRYVLWSIDSGDWRLRDSSIAEEAGRTLAAAVKPRDVVLMHDDNPHTPTLLSNLLPGVRGRGLAAVTL